MTEWVLLGGTGTIERKEGDKPTTTSSGMYHHSLLLYDSYSIATSYETPMDGLGRATVGHKSRGPAVLWAGSVILTQIPDETMTIFGVV